MKLTLFVAALAVMIVFVLMHSFFVMRALDVVIGLVIGLAVIFAMTYFRRK